MVLSPFYTNQDHKTVEFGVVYRHRLIQVVYRRFEVCGTETSDSDYLQADMRVR